MNPLTRFRPRGDTVMGIGGCRARLEPGVAGPYHGRCDLHAGHAGNHRLERGMDTIWFRTALVTQPASSRGQQR